MANQRKYYKEYVKDCICLIGGNTVEPDLIKVRTMNFGQHWRTPGIQNLSYKISIPKQYAIDYLKIPFNELVDMFISEKDDEDKLSMELELIHFDYPRDLNLLFNEYNHYKKLVLEILDWYGTELLDFWVGDENKQMKTEYVLNSIDKTYMTGNLIFFEGQCRNNNYKNIKYQDR